MQLQLSPWGNSLGLRVPKALLLALGLNSGATLDATVEHGKLVLKPTNPIPHYTVEQLCAQITPENRHSETNWGPDVGLEIIDDDWS